MTLPPIPKSMLRRLIYAGFDVLRFLGFKRAVYWVAQVEQRVFKTGNYHAILLYCYRHKEFGLCNRLMDAFIAHFSSRLPSQPTTEQQHTPGASEQGLKQSMVSFFKATHSAGFKPFIAFGSLLGYVREKRFIPWDRDLDIGLFYDETAIEKLVQTLKAADFRITEYTGTAFPCKIKCQLKGHPQIDIAFFKREGGKLLTFGRLGNGEHIIRKRTSFRLADAVFYGVPIRIPEHPEIFLTENYGDWQTPKEAYHYILDSKLTEYQSTPDIRYLAMGVLILHLQRNNKPAVAHYLALFIEKMPEDSLWTTIKQKLYACHDLH